MFAPIDDSDEAFYDRLSKTERRGSQSNTSAEEKRFSTGIKEYRAMESIHDPGNRRRRRRQHGGRLLHLNASMDEKDPIQDLSDDESFASHSKPRSATDSADLAILGVGKKAPKSPGRQNFTHTVDRNKKRLNRSDMNGEIDELAGDPDYSSSHPTKKLDAGHTRHKQASSLSISSRGDLKPSLAAGAQSKPLGDNSVPLKVAVWKPSRIYDASEPSTEGENAERVVLSSREVSPTQAVLTLLREDSLEEAPEYGWFQIQSWKMRRYKINYDKCFVKVTAPNSIDTNLGATLYLQLYSPEDTHKFGRWVRRYSNENLEPDPQDTLVREFEKALAEIKNRPAPKANSLTTTRMDPEVSPQNAQRGVAVTAGRTLQPKRRLIDEMDPSSVGGSRTYGYNINEDSSIEESRPRRSLRSQRGLSYSPPISALDRWTEANPDWAKNWRLPLSFHRTMIDKDDIPRLDEGQCLNDNIIGFYLKYLQLQAEKQRPESSKRIYFHNSFFYSKLKPTTGRHINYDGVKNWTAKVDIFAYDYIVVPVNEHFHWWVAIICNPGKLDSTVAQSAAGSPGSAVEEIEEVLPSGTHLSSSQGGNDATQDHRDANVTDDKGGAYELDDPFRLPDNADELNAEAAVSGKAREDAVTVDDDAVPTRAKKGRKTGRKSFGAPPRKYNPADPRIITLDSLGASHSPVCSHLKQYLIAEFRDKKNKEIDYEKPTIGMRATNIPEQDNFCDCGVYLLKYVAEFLSDPDRFIQGILLRENRPWNFNASEMRNEIRQLIFDMHGPYQQEQEEVKRQKLLAKRKRDRGKSEAPGDDPAPSVSKSPGESPVSAQRPADSELPSSSGPSAAASDQGLPRAIMIEPTEQTECSTNSTEARGNGLAETVPYESRVFHVITDRDSKEAAATSSTPQSVQSPNRASQPLPSIEIADDDDAPLVPTEGLESSLRQISLGVNRGSVEKSDDKVVEVPSGDIKPSQMYRRKRSESQTDASVVSAYQEAPEQTVHDGKGKKAAKLGSPARPMSSTNRTSACSTPPTRRAAADAVPGQTPMKSPYFDSGRKPGPLSRIKTYKGARKTPNGGHTIDLTDD